MNIDVIKGLSKQIVDHFGKENQEYKLLEELEELYDELGTNIRENTITENTILEMADVCILITQLLIKYDKQEKYNEAVEYKLTRTIKRIKEGYYK